MRYLKIGGTWLLTIALAILMAGPGSEKFTSNTWERMFRRWGYPEHFYLVIGAIEVLGGLLLLVPKTASYSAIVLAIVMIGASATQILRGGRNGVGEMVFASLLVLLAIIRWKDRLRVGSKAAARATAAS